MVTIRKLAACPVTPMGNGRGTMIQLVGEESGARFVDVHLNVLRPGGAAGRYHYHARTENVYWILEGRGRLVVEGEARTVEKDDVVFLPPGTPHSLTNAGDGELRLLEIYAPAGRDFVAAEAAEPGA